MGSTSAGEIESSVQSSPSGANTFEAFVKNAVQKIQREAWGRSSEVVEIRNACQSFLDYLNTEDGGAAKGVPFKEQSTRAALEPLKLACSCSIARIVEPALGCLHKLVAYAWIQGEGSETGNMDDGTLVSEIVSMVVKCTQLGNSSVYLAVIRALLTFATAEHFIAHGHCLLHMVRTVFNMAVSCEDNNIKRTSCNALLQMLNTVVKRVTVTQFQLTSHRSSLKSDVFDEPEGTTPKKQSLVETQSLSTHSEITPDPTGDQHSPDDPDSSNEASSTWKLADLAEKEDIEALEAAFENKQRDMEEPLSPKSIPQGNDNSLNSQSASDAAKADSESTQNQSVQEPTPKKSKRPRGWDQLTVLEKDVLVVLMAFCKLAGVNTTISVGDMYVRQGKLLALELLVKVFENTGHRWENVRTEFCEQLRLPLCLVLIRNCTPTESKGFQFAIRLFVSVLMQRQIRLGLKPELGALYPLLLLRPLESDSLEPALLTVTLAAIKRISKEPQMQVDIFINYDCNLKAPNLYERTAKALSQLAVYGDPNANSNQSSILRDAAATCSMTMLASLDSWAGPVRDAANVGTNFTETSFSDGREPTSNGNGSIIGNTSEVRHFGAAKEKKNSFSLGIELFNKSPSKGIASLVASGVVLNQPDTIAGFLRKHKEQLDDAMLGEYLGLNDDMPLKVMYAFIDMEKYEGLTIDAALRKLLAQFRLPGEAQKIDRIMEKFAERFCQDNPGVFHSADNAYVLAFSLIMLNTDLHNPMAEKKLTKQDFISMNQRQESDGSFVEVLPVSELESIFDRIAMNEIQTSANSNLSLKKLEDALALHRTLASAVGLTQLALPFRSGKVWDKIRGAQIEHEHLLAMTQKAMRSGTVDADLWFTATHTEHSRPMFEVAGPYFHKALTAAMESAVDKESAEKSVSSLVMAIHLAALLGLDTLCQQFVSTLCRAIGVHTKEALIRTNPARQICALRALIGVASDDQAGLLGNSWALILRTISSVEALITDMRRSHKSDQSVFEESMQALKFQSFDRKDHDRSSAIGRFFNQIGLVRADSDLYSSVAPGQAIRLWSEGEGVTEMDRIFVRSASLDGEAVVIFCKALCLISQEELTPGISHLEAMSPRVFSLRKLVECAYYNLGRIRLIWGRLWSTIASHLVNASCHSDQTVAMYSVDSLRQLVGKLLSRDELANFTTQSDTLKPFVMVLKQCANVVVRELAVQCIEQAMNTHSSRLGSGWVIVLEFLTVASLDPAPSVTRQCLDTLHSAISVHWRKWGRGRDALADCVNVALRVARNPHNLDCSLRAIQLIKSSADELVIELGGAYDNHVETNRSISVDYSHNETPTELPRTSSVPNAPTPQQEKKEAAAAAAANQVEPLLNRSALWTMVFESLVEIITREERRRCADLAADVLFSFIQTEFVRTWDRATWNAFFSVALVKVFDQRENAYSMESGLDRILSYSTSFFPALWSAVASNYDKNGKLLLAHLMDVLVGWMENSREAVALSGVYLFQDLVDGVSKNLDKDGWRVVLENLRFAWTVCVGGKKPVTFTEKDSESILDQPFKSWTDKIDHNLALPQLKTRCQVLISLQRVMHRIHEQNGQLLSLKMLSELTDLILDAVQQVTEANKDAKFIKALRSCLVDTNENTGQVHPQRIQSFEQSEIQIDEQEESQEAPEGALVKLLSLKVDPSQSSSMQSSSSPPVEDIPQLKKIVHSDESVFHGLLKLQIEGGVLTIEALKRQASYKGENDQLYSFCRKVITQASSEIRSLVANSGHEGMDSHWEQAIKAPLISKAFEIFQEAEGEVLLKELKELGPHLSTLICSRELSIRQSVANFLKLKSSTIFDLTM